MNEATSSNSVGIIRPFGPSIAKIQMPPLLLKTINQYVDDEISEEGKAIDYGHTLAGNVTQELQLSNAFLEESGFLKFLAVTTEFWIQGTIGRDITKFDLKGCWAVRQFQGDYNPVHSHSGHISGVGYLKLPSNFGSYKQKTKKNNKNGHIEFIHGDKNFLSNPVFSVTPEIADFYLFPNYLLHTVYPFLGEGERRSVSFNAIIDEQIYESV